MPVHAQAGPMLMDKMSKAIEQIEREVKTKGLFQGASAHAMQQGVLLVAEDQDKVKVYARRSLSRRRLRSGPTTFRPSTSRSPSIGLGTSIPASCMC